ncbi:MAG: hypothetical protein ACRDF9_10155 [Candidatus Limnocylindria bacterium]
MSRQELRLLVLAAAVSIPVAILGVAVALAPETTDFRCFWTGSAFLLTGQDPYDLEVWTRATSSLAIDAFGRLNGGNCFGTYPYPLTTAVAMLPFGVLPLGIAAVIWEILIFAGAVAGVALLAQAAGLSRRFGLMLVVVVLMSQPFEQNVMSAQFGGLSLLALGLLAAPKLGSGRAGVGLVLAAMKPHVIPLVPLVRARGERLALIAAALAPLALIALVSLALRPTWPMGWLAELGGQRREMLGIEVTVWTLASVAGIPALGPALVAAGIAPLAVAARRARDLHVVELIAVVALAWLIVNPYGLTASHLAPLAVAWVAIMRRAVTPTTSAPLVVALFAVASVLPWAMYLVRFDVLAYGGLEVASALIPPATAAVLAAALARSTVIATNQERSVNSAATLA